jgi:hypothetical protein
MRNWIIGAAALLAVAVPGVAAAGSGYAGVAYVNNNIDIFGADIDADTWVADGAVAFDAGPVGVQLDGRIGNSELDVFGDFDFWNVGGHVYKRSGAWLIGGYAGYGNVDAGGGDADEWTVALEGEYYMAQTTLGGALSYSEADDLDFETTAIDVGARHFLNDNFAINADLGFANVETSGGDVDATTFGVGGEYQFASFPVSVFAGYQRAEVDDIDLEVDSIGVGVRYNWGGSLIDRNRSGAGLARRGGLISRVLGAI